MTPGPLAALSNTAATELERLNEKVKCQRIDLDHYKTALSETEERVRVLTEERDLAREECGELRFKLKWAEDERNRFVKLYAKSQREAEADAP